MKTQYVFSAACLPSRLHTGTLMLVPYLAFTYDMYVEGDSWRIFFRAISHFIFLIPPILALVEAPARLRFVVLPT